MQESQTAQSNTGLIYGLNDRPPVREAIFAAIQHLLAIFVAIITPPLIIAGALKLDLETTRFGMLPEEWGSRAKSSKGF